MIFVVLNGFLLISPNLLGFLVILVGLLIVQVLCYDVDRLIIILGTLRRGEVGALAAGPRIVERSGLAWDAPAPFAEGRTLAPYLTVRDQVGNVRAYESTQLGEAGFPPSVTVESPNADTAPPSLKAGTVLAQWEQDLAMLHDTAIVPPLALGTLRFSLGHETTDADVELATMGAVFDV